MVPIKEFNQLCTFTLVVMDYTLFELIPNNQLSCGECLVVVMETCFSVLALLFFNHQFDMGKFMKLAMFCRHVETFNGQHTSVSLV